MNVMTISPWTFGQEEAMFKRNPGDDAKRDPEDTAFGDLEKEEQHRAIREFARQMDALMISLTRKAKFNNGGETNGN